MIIFIRHCVVQDQDNVDKKTLIFLGLSVLGLGVVVQSRGRGCVQQPGAWCAGLELHWNYSWNTAGILFIRRHRYKGHRHWEFIDKNIFKRNFSPQNIIYRPLKHQNSPDFWSDCVRADTEIRNLFWWILAPPRPGPTLQLFWNKIAGTWKRLKLNPPFLVKSLDAIERLHK